MWADMRWAVMPSGQKSFRWSFEIFWLRLFVCAAIASKFARGVGRGGTLPSLPAPTARRTEYQRLQARLRPQTPHFLSKLPSAAPRPLQQHQVSRQQPLCAESFQKQCTRGQSLFETLKSYGNTVNPQTQKNTFLIHTRFLIMDTICWETHARFLLCVYFFPGNTCAFPVYDGNTSRFQTQHVNSGNTFLIHTRFQVKCYASDCKHIRVSVLDSIFGKNTCAFPICLCFFAKNTCAFPLCFSLFARNTCAFPTSPISSRDV